MDHKSDEKSLKTLIMNHKSDLNLTKISKVINKNKQNLLFFKKQDS